MTTEPCETCGLQWAPTTAKDRQLADLRAKVAELEAQLEHKDRTLVWECPYCSTRHQCTGKPSIDCPRCGNGDGKWWIVDEGILQTQTQPETRPSEVRSDALFGADDETCRGFGIVKFRDERGKECSLQISSRAVCENEDGTVDDPLGWIWLGIDDPEPLIMKTRARELGMPLPPGEVGGWMPYPVPEDVLMHTRMHLNEQQVRGLIARLQTWLDTGELSTPNKNGVE